MGDLRQPVEIEVRRPDDDIRRFDHG